MDQALSKPRFDVAFLASLTFVLACGAFSLAAYRANGVVKARTCARAAVRTTIAALDGNVVGTPTVTEAATGLLYRVQMFSAGRDVLVNVFMKDRRANGGNCQASDYSVDGGPVVSL